MGRISPPAGVFAYHQVVGLMLPDKDRTLPSHKPTIIPLLWGVETFVGSQLPWNGFGCTWNIDWESEIGPNAAHK